MLILIWAVLCLHVVRSEPQYTDDLEGFPDDPNDPSSPVYNPRSDYPPDRRIEQQYVDDPNNQNDLISDDDLNHQVIAPYPPKSRSSHANDYNLKNSDESRSDAANLNKDYTSEETTRRFLPNNKNYRVVVKQKLRIHKPKKVNVNRIVRTKIKRTRPVVHKVVRHYKGVRRPENSKVYKIYKSEKGGKKLINLTLLDTDSNSDSDSEESVKKIKTKKYIDSDETDESFEKGYKNVYSKKSKSKYLPSYNKLELWNKGNKVKLNHENLDMAPVHQSLLNYDVDHRWERRYPKKGQYQSKYKANYEDNNGGYIIKKKIKNMPYLLVNPLSSSEEESEYGDNKYDSSLRNQDDTKENLPKTYEEETKITYPKYDLSELLYFPKLRTYKEIVKKSRHPDYVMTQYLNRVSPKLKTNEEETVKLAPYQKVNEEVTEVIPDYDVTRYVYQDVKKPNDDEDDSSASEEQESAEIQHLWELNSTVNDYPPEVNEFSKRLQQIQHFLTQYTDNKGYNDVPLTENNLDTTIREIKKSYEYFSSLNGSSPTDKTNLDDKLFEDNTESAPRDEGDNSTILLVGTTSQNDFNYTTNSYPLKESPSENKYDFDGELYTENVENTPVDKGRNSTILLDDNIEQNDYNYTTNLNSLTDSPLVDKDDLVDEILYVDKAENIVNNLNPLRESPLDDTIDGDSRTAYLNSTDEGDFSVIPIDKHPRNEALSTSEFYSNNENESSPYFDSEPTGDVNFKEDVPVPEENVDDATNNLRVKTDLISDLEEVIQDLSEEGLRSVSTDAPDAYKEEVEDVTYPLEQDYTTKGPVPNLYSLEQDYTTKGPVPVARQSLELGQDYTTKGPVPVARQSLEQGQDYTTKGPVPIARQSLELGQDYTTKGPVPIARQSLELGQDYTTKGPVPVARQSFHLRQDYTTKGPVPFRSEELNVDEFPKKSNVRHSFLSHSYVSNDVGGTFVSKPKYEPDYSSEEDNVGAEVSTDKDTNLSLSVSTTPDSSISSDTDEGSGKPERNIERTRGTPFLQHWTHYFDNGGDYSGSDEDSKENEDDSTEEPKSTVTKRPWAAEGSDEESDETMPPRKPLFLQTLVSAPDEDSNKESSAEGHSAAVVRLCKLAKSNLKNLRELVATTYGLNTDTADENDLITIVYILGKLNEARATKRPVEKLVDDFLVNLQRLAVLRKLLCEDFDNDQAYDELSGEDVTDLKNDIDILSLFKGYLEKTGKNLTSYYERHYPNDGNTAYIERLKQSDKNPGRIGQDRWAINPVDKELELTEWSKIHPEIVISSTIAPSDILNKLLGMHKAPTHVPPTVKPPYIVPTVSDHFENIKIVNKFPSTTPYPNIHTDYIDDYATTATTSHFDYNNLETNDNLNNFYESSSGEDTTAVPFEDWVVTPNTYVDPNHHVDLNHNEDLNNNYDLNHQEVFNHHENVGQNVDLNQNEVPNQNVDFNHNEDLNYHEYINHKHKHHNAQVNHHVDVSNNPGYNHNKNLNHHTGVDRPLDVNHHENLNQHGENNHHKGFNPNGGKKHNDLNHNGQHNHHAINIGITSTESYGIDGVSSAEYEELIDELKEFQELNHHANPGKIKLPSGYKEPQMNPGKKFKHFNLISNGKKYAFGGLGAENEHHHKVKIDGVIHKVDLENIVKIAHYDSVDHGPVDEEVRTLIDQRDRVNEAIFTELIWAEIHKLRSAHVDEYKIDNYIEVIVTHILPQVYQDLKSCQDLKLSFIKKKLKLKLPK